MATLDFLKRELRSAAAAINFSQPPEMDDLSDEQYSAGFATLAGQKAYRDFIIPQLSSLLETLLETRASLSILEIGPGPKSVLARLPGYLQRRIGRYTAFEPNRLFAADLEEALRSAPEGGEAQLPCLEKSPDIRKISFPPEDTTNSDSQDTFDVVLFCHSMYGMKNKLEVTEHALGSLCQGSGDEMVVMFHRDGNLRLDGFVCQRMAMFLTGIVHVSDEDDVLDVFADFVAGSAMRDTAAAKNIHEPYRKVCRSLGGRSEERPGYLTFSSPEIMVTFDRHATNLPALTNQVPLASGESRIKNREARIRHPAAVIRPETIQQVQQCVRWALDNNVGLSIVGGSHSGNCSWSHVVAVDMSAFSEIHVLPAGIEDASTSTDAFLERLLCDRGYKEQHRQALTAYFQERAEDHPNYPQESFLKVVYGNAGAEVLFVMGMRQHTPVAAVAHLVPGTKVVEIRVQTSEETRRSRGAETENHGSNRWTGLVFDNGKTGEQMPKAFAKYCLLPFLDEDLLRLVDMVPTVADFPRSGVQFQHVLKIAQHRGGMGLCTSLMQRLSNVNWTNVDAIVGCEAGGFVFASALAVKVDVPLVLVRKAGKLPPPTISAAKSASHISWVATHDLEGERIEVDRALVSKAHSVVVVDDVLATGHTLCAVLSLLTQAGIKDSDITVMVVAEFPAHRGREMLCRSGFGRAQVQSLLVFEGT